MSVNYFIRYTLQKGEGSFPKIPAIRTAYPGQDPLEIIKANMNFLFNNDNGTLPVLESKLINDGLDNLEIDEDEYTLGPKPVVCLKLAKDINPKDSLLWDDALKSDYQLIIKNINSDDPFYFQDHNGYSKVFYSELISDELWELLEELIKIEHLENSMSIKDNFQIKKYRNYHSNKINYKPINIAFEIVYNFQVYIWGFTFETLDELAMLEISDYFYIDPFENKYPGDNCNIWNIYQILFENKSMIIAYE